MSRPEEIDPLTPMLDAAQSELAERLEDLCRVKHVEEESTGEFMKLEEKLLDAARAAKQAFSLRRRIRTAREGGGMGATAAGTTDAPADRDTHVGVREVEDANGVRWQVWAVTPQRMRASATTSDQLLGDYREGWLTFESADGAHRRRLPHFPTDWETLDDAALAALVARADAVRVTRTEMPKVDENEASA